MIYKNLGSFNLLFYYVFALPIVKIVHKTAERAIRDGNGSGSGWIEQLLVYQQRGYG
jgi:hypothetical protein